MSKAERAHESPPAARDGRLALALAAALVTVIVFAAYYLVHKPLSPAQALAYLDTLGNLGVAALLVALGGGLGGRLLRRLAGPALPEAPGIRVILAVALGWGLLAVCVLALGLARLLYAGLMWGLVLLALFFVRQNVRLWLGDVTAAVRGLAPRGRVEKAAAGYVLGVLLLGGLQAAAPPLKWDALVYHLALPRRYVEAHSVYLRPEDFSFFTGMPQLAEMLYAAAMLLRLDLAAGAIAAQLLGWAAGVLLALGLAATARARGWGGWVAPAILFSSFSVAAALAWAYVEMLLMLLALASVCALVVWQQRRSLRWAAIAGVLGGLAFGCKYTGLIVPLGGLAIVLHAQWRDRASGTAGPRRWAAAGLFVLAAALAGAPWLIKNWALTGSPVYPLLLPAADVDAARLWFYNRPDLTERSAVSAALIFWRSAFWGVQGANSYDVSLGPLLVLLPAALVLGWKYWPPQERAEVSPWLVFTGVAYLVWVGAVFQSKFAEQARLFFAGLPVLALVGAAGWSALLRLDTARLRLSFFLGIALALAFGLSGLEVFHHFVGQQPLPYLTGRQTRGAYEFNQLGWYAAAMQAVNALPAGTRVMFLWEARSLACAAHIQCVPDVIIDRWWRLRQDGPTASAVLEQWRQAGVSHVLVYEAGLAFVQADATHLFLDADWDELEALRVRLQPVERYGSDYTLFALP